MESIKVIKIGGNVIDSPEALERFIADFAKIEGPKILVHGGGKIATRVAEKLELEVTMIEGRRVTDKGMLDVVTMVYAGLINKQVVAMLQAAGCSSIGMSGADGGIVTAKRRSPEPIDYGFVGDITDVNTDLIATLLGAGITPVLCAIMSDAKGGLLNCNADSVASALAKASAKVAPTDLIFCFEKLGVMGDINDDGTLISQITEDSFQELRSQGVINKGMIPKIEGALAAVKQGVRSVEIKHSDNLLNQTGTVIK